MNIVIKFSRKPGGFSEKLEEFDISKIDDLNREIFEFIDPETNERLVEKTNAIFNFLQQLGINQKMITAKYRSKDYQILVENNANVLVIGVKKTTTAKDLDSLFGVEFDPIDEYGPICEIRDFTFVVNPKSSIVINTSNTLRFLNIIKDDLEKEIKDKLTHEIEGKENEAEESDNTPETNNTIEHNQTRVENDSTKNKKKPNSEEPTSEHTGKNYREGGETLRKYLKDLKRRDQDEP